MQIIILLLILFLFCLISFQFSSIFEIYSQEDLVIDEKVQITISKDNETLIVPAKIGIEPGLWKDHTFDNYSFDPNHTSPLTTNNYNGTININQFAIESLL